MPAGKATARQVVHIRKGDMVRVMSGRDREKFRNTKARVLSVDPVTLKVTVEHAQMVKRHTRPNPAKNVKGGIVEREGAIHISNVQIVCPACNKATRVGHKPRPEGGKPRRMRVCVKCGASLDK
jgi:large subunit ribosomal protein L24